MRFHLGSIPAEFTPDSSWKPIREPGPAVFQLLATPVGIGSALLVGYAWHRIGVPPLQFNGQEAPFVFLAVALSFPLLIALHELLHACLHPHFGRSNATIIGAWPSRLLFYAHYSGPLSRNRFLAIFLPPIVVLTLLPLALGFAGLLPSKAMLVASWFSTWNALFACGDVVGFWLIALQVPRRAVLQNESWRTYWKLADTGQAAPAVPARAEDRHVTGDRPESPARAGE